MGACTIGTDAVVVIVVHNSAFDSHSILCSYFGARDYVASKAFAVEVASAGVWKTILTTSSNNFNSTKYFGPAVSGHVLRIRMSTVRISLTHDFLLDASS